MPALLERAAGPVNRPEASALALGACVQPATDYEAGGAEQQQGRVAGFGHRSWRFGILRTTGTAAARGAPVVGTRRGDEQGRGGKGGCSEQGARKLHVVSPQGREVETQHGATRAS